MLDSHEFGSCLYSSCAVRFHRMLDCCCSKCVVKLTLHDEPHTLFKTAFIFVLQSLPCTCGLSHGRTMMLDGTYSEADSNSLAGYTRPPMATEEPPEKQERTVVHLSLDRSE